MEASASAAAAAWLAPIDQALAPGPAAVRSPEKVLGTLPFVGEGSFPLEKTVGAGLGERRTLDLATLSRGALVTPSERFFVRTGCPDRLPPTTSWKVRLHGFVQKPVEVGVEELRREAADQGAHLVECAGNSRAAHFGLMSVARWTGVPLPRVLERARPLPKASQVLVSGFDEHAVADPGSVPGASWIFGLEQIRGSGAFLATEMNGAPLGADHGYPLRLVMPGWYGCASIKWVNEIALVDDAAPATGQMKEYAGRTGQDPVGPRDAELMRAGRRPEGPPRAKDFRPATIDPAATPVRVEKRRAGDGRISYRIVGIVWGPPVRSLRIRLNPDRPYEPVEDAASGDARTWTLWSHRFPPPPPGRYRIELAVGDPGVRTRRLDARFYAREIEIA